MLSELNASMISDVVGAVRRVADGQPCIAQHDVRVIAAVRQELEGTRISRDTLDDGIDLVERPILSGVGIAAEFAGSQPDHRDMPRAWSKRREEPAERALLAVVGHRQRFLAGHKAPHAMQRGAVHQCQCVRGTIVDDADAINAEEAAVCGDRIACAGRRGGEQQDGNAETEAPPSRGKVQQRERRQHIAECRHKQQQHAAAGVGGTDGIGQQHKAQQGERQHDIPRQAAPCIVGRRGLHQARGDQCQGIFPNAGEDQRRQQRVERAPENATEGEEEVELRELRGGRPSPCQLAVTDHRDDKEAAEMQRQHQRQRQYDRQPGCRGDHQWDQQQRQHTHHDRMAQRRPAREGKDEGEQIQHQRHHPQQRRGRDIRGDVRGDAE